MEAVGFVVFGYLLGSCPWGYWLVLAFKGTDIRREGSGNIGGSNVWRTYGARLGLPVLLLDAAKGFVPAFLGVKYGSHVIGIGAGAAAIAGHWRPLFLGFARGGKVIATGGGVFLAIAPLAAGTALAIWVVLFLIFGFASIASVVAALSMSFSAWAYGYPLSVVLFAVVVGVLAVFLHRANLRRLWHHNEAQSSIALTRRLGFGHR
jgi:glycerol-3-phosphate acyltransferase PlsY